MTFCTLNKHSDRKLLALIYSVWLLIPIIAIVLGASLLFLCMGCVGCGYVSDAKQTVFDNTKASTLLRRYEWFKDAAATLDARKASIQIYEGRFASLKAAYEGKPRSQWSREDREQSNLWEQELAGIKASYNSLCGEFNSAMAKDNYRFCNVGDLPAGATQPLPRAYKPYLEQ